MLATALVCFEFAVASAATFIEDLVMERSKSALMAAAVGYILAASPAATSAGHLFTGQISSVEKTKWRPGTGYPDGPCNEVKAACRRAGFVPGGAGTGIGLAVDCVRPIIEGTPQPRRARAPLPQVDPRTLAACRASLGPSGAPSLEAGPRPSPGYDASSPSSSGAPPSPSNSPGANQSIEDAPPAPKNVPNSAEPPP
jgi:hypothetical protein